MVSIRRFAPIDRRRAEVDADVPHDALVVFLGSTTLGLGRVLEDQHLAFEGLDLFDLGGGNDFEITVPFAPLLPMPVSARAEPTADEVDRPLTPGERPGRENEDDAVTR